MRQGLIATVIAAGLAALPAAAYGRYDGCSRHGQSHVSDETKLRPTYQQHATSLRVEVSDSNGTERGG
jgi:hypothetical protein